MNEKCIDRPQQPRENKNRKERREIVRSMADFIEMLYMQGAVSTEEIKHIEKLEQDYYLLD